MKYSLDTSALLDGWVRYYPPTVFPTIWSNIEALIVDGELKASVEVLNDLKKKDDEVYKWANAQSEMFLPLDAATQKAVSTILFKHPRLVDTRKSRSVSDPFVIATASVNGAAVVTSELPSGNIQKPKIPDVCLAENISCITLLQLFLAEGWRI